jgi:hypothetical protein
MDTFISLLLIVFVGIIVSSQVSVYLKQKEQIKKLKTLDEAAKQKAGTRGITEILEDVAKHDAGLKACQLEIIELIKLVDAGKAKPNLLEIIPPKKSKLVDIVFNSEEIGCRYKDLEIPKFLKSAEDNWYEFESIAVFDSHNKAIVDDAKAEYIIISNKDIKTDFFYKKLDKKPILNENLEMSQENL